MNITRYSYNCRSPQGEKIKGKINAISLNHVVNKLATEGLTIIDIKEIEDSKLNKLNLYIIKFSNLGLYRQSNKQLMFLCRQFQAMLQAGMPILDILTQLGEQADNNILKQSLCSAKLLLSEGSPLHEAFARQGKTFPALFINMVKAGEAGGFLDLTMKNLAEHFEKQHIIEEKIRSALTYPVMVIGVAIAVILVMIIFVLPQFDAIFHSMGIEMPFLNSLLLKFGQLIKTKWHYLLLLTLIFLFILKATARSVRGQLIINYLILKFPLSRNIYRITVAARFSRMLEVLLKSGINLSFALQLIASLMDNNVIKSSFKEIASAVNRGESLTSSIAKYKHFPRLLTQMVRTGEETGTLPAVMEVSANYFEDELSYILGRLGTMLEPVLLLIVGLFVGILVYSVLSPMYQVFQMI